MSENLKRAESLFNRIMNQTTNSDSSTSSFASQSSTSTTPILESSPTTSNTTTANTSTSRPNILGSRKFNSSSYSVPTVSSNIPKLDIEKLTREALASVPESHHYLIVGPYGIIQEIKRKNKDKKYRKNYKSQLKNNCQSNNNNKVLESIHIYRPLMNWSLLTFLLGTQSIILLL